MGVGLSNITSPFEKLMATPSPEPAAPTLAPVAQQGVEDPTQSPPAATAQPTAQLSAGSPPAPDQGQGDADAAALSQPIPGYSPEGFPTGVMGAMAGGAANAVFQTKDFLLVDRR